MASSPSEVRVDMLRAEPLCARAGRTRAPMPTSAARPGWQLLHEPGSLATSAEPQWACGTSKREAIQIKAGKSCQVSIPETVPFSAMFLNFSGHGDCLLFIFRTHPYPPCRIWIGLLKFAKMIFTNDHILFTCWVDQQLSPSRSALPAAAPGGHLSH